MAAINEIRLNAGTTPILHAAIYIYPGVIRKLRQKRIIIGKMSAEQVSRLAANVIYGMSEVFPSRFPQIQVLASINPDNKTADVVYVGDHRSCVSLKSAYINDVKDINKQALEGGGQPSSKPVESRSTIFSGPQGSIVKVTKLYH